MNERIGKCCLLILENKEIIPADSHRDRVKPWLAHFWGVEAWLRKKWCEGVIEKTKAWWCDYEKIGRVGVIGPRLPREGVINVNGLIPWLHKNYGVKAWLARLAENCGVMKAWLGPPWRSLFKWNDRRMMNVMNLNKKCVIDCHIMTFTWGSLVYSPQ